MDMPPSRYRVVEQGRRLVVVDARTGQPVAPPAPVRPAGNNLRPAASAAAAGGNPTFVTSRLYDNKAPRTIVLDQGNSRRTGPAFGLAIVVVAVVASLCWWMPTLLIVIFFALANGGFRRALRTGVTKWLDNVAQDSGSSAG